MAFAVLHMLRKEQVEKDLIMISERGIEILSTIKWRIFVDILFGLTHLLLFNGATKSYFMHYSCVVIVLFKAVLYRSAFSTISLRKLVFCFFVLSLNQDIKMCVIMLCNFVLTLNKNSPFVNYKLFLKFYSIM